MVVKVICSCVVCKKEYPSKGIFTHYNQAHNPKWEDKWKIKNASANEARRQTIQNRTREKHANLQKIYDCNPIICMCGNPIPYEKRRNKYCTHSCGATQGNISKGGRSEETKNKIRAALKNRPCTKPRTRSYVNRYSKVCFYNCKSCGKIIYSRSAKPGRKTCSDECRTHACVGVRPYKNGRRLISYYYNKHQGKDVMLESTWEVKIAEFLDKNDIKWIRPSYTKWFDPIKDKMRLYYPDFYLPDIDLYLDPKNPTAIRDSIDKMNIVTKLIPLVYGSLEEVTSKVIEMYFKEGKIVEA